jgi:hypothetical protein
MKDIPQYLAHFSVTAWVGSLWSLAYLAVPVLFYAQPDKQLAGMLAGQIFIKGGYLGMACGLYLLTFFFTRSGFKAFSLNIFWIICGMLLITLTIQYGIQPFMSKLKLQALPLDVMSSGYAGQFKMLHGISSIAYLIESLLGALLVIKSRVPAAFIDK